jgi:hypothetical protein
MTYTVFIVYKDHVYYYTDPACSAFLMALDLKERPETCLLLKMRGDPK